MKVGFAMNQSCDLVISVCKIVILRIKINRKIKERINILATLDTETELISENE